MKVKIGPYKNWYGPYQLAETLCFWAKDVEDEYGFKRKPDWVHNFGEWLAHGSVEPEAETGTITSWDRDRPNTWLYRLMLWIDSKRRRRVQVHIDRWDTWNMDDTLAYIILPMLKQLKEKKHGAPGVDDEDVPEHLRSTAAPPVEDYETDGNWHKRWDWVMDEMIFAFETKTGSLTEWEEQFHTGEHDIQWKKLDDGCSQMIKGPNDTHKFDAEGHAAFHKRISNGFRLFGKYYEGLWD